MSHLLFPILIEKCPLFVNPGHGRIMYKVSILISTLSGLQSNIVQNKKIQPSFVQWCMRVVMHPGLKYHLNL